MNNPHPSPLPNGRGDVVEWIVGTPLDWRVQFGLWLRNTPSQKNKHRALLSLQAYERDMHLMAVWFEKQYGVAFEPCDMNEQNLGEYFAQFENAPATHKRKRASLKLFVRWALDAGVIDYDPSVWIGVIDVVEDAPRDLTDEERTQLEAMAEAGEMSLLGLRDSIIFFLMNDAGLRISEVIGLLLSDLHLDEGYIHVLGKGEKHRKVRIASRLIGKIRLWLERMPASVEGTLVTDENGLAICRQTAWSRFVILREKAGVNATPHSMRHTYVLRYIDAFMKGDMGRLGAALKAVCLQTGDDIKTIIKYYTGPRESDLRAAAEAM